MATTARGRGFGRGTADSSNAQILRRPGEAGLMQRLESLSTETCSYMIPYKDPFLLISPSFGLHHAKGLVQSAPIKVTKNMEGYPVLTSRGRGFGQQSADSSNAQTLRRPGEAGLMQILKSLSAETVDISSEISDVCENMMKMNLSSKTDLSLFTDRIKAICLSLDDLEKCVESIYLFAVKSKWNAHVFAILCNSIGDILVNEVKLRTYLLRKLQAVYKERNKKYLELDSFLLDVTFLCEIYHHIRIDGKCLKILSRPVIDYFGMMIDGASQKEIEVFVEQFPKCYQSLKENDQSGLDSMVNKLRKQIICEASNIIVKAMLLEVFEHVLTDFEPLNENAKNQYESLCKPIRRICE